MLFSKIASNFGTPGRVLGSAVAVTAPVVAVVQLEQAYAQGVDRADFHVPSAIPFGSSSELIQKWQGPGLYVKGQDVISSTEQSYLATMLGNRPNWTVILMNSIEGEQFDNLRGLDAVRARVGKELQGSDRFKSLTDSASGAQAASILLILWDYSNLEKPNRSIFYFPSPYHEQFGAGGGKWNEVFLPDFKNAMSGEQTALEKVTQAVKNTELTDLNRGGLPRIERSLSTSPNLADALIGLVNQIDQTARKQQNIHTEVKKVREDAFSEAFFSKLFRSLKYSFAAGLAVGVAVLAWKRLRRKKADDKQT